MNTTRNIAGITRRSAMARIATAATTPWVAASIARLPTAQGSFLMQSAAATPTGTAKASVVERLPNGVEVWQVSTERFEQSNIYTEASYCSADSRYFVYERTNPKNADNPTEFIIAELGTWKQHLLDSAISLQGCAITRQGIFYYLKRAAGGKIELRRANLAKGSPEVVYRRKPGHWIETGGTVTPDARYYSGLVRLDDRWKMFGIVLLDLHTGKETIIDRDPYDFNAHTQFEPAKGKWLLIQYNRGGYYSPDGQIQRLVGPEGATLFLLSVPEGKRTLLQVGTPYTAPITGHETWIGDTGEIMLSVVPEGEFSAEKGNLLAVKPGERARVVAKGFSFNHLGVSPCGRFFCADDWRGACKLVVGSVRTGKTAVLCEARVSMGEKASSHPHAYLTPDLKWVIFNSDRSGLPHIHAARMPPALLKSLET
jgi:hypothetical protein